MSTIRKARLGTAVLPDTPAALTENNVSSYRAVETLEATADNLGPLAELPGHWQGTGFSLIARPDFDPENESGFFLQLNLIRESIDFTTIGSAIPNRGSKQDDIAIFGVTYLQRVTDSATGGALHIEPGLFVRVPPTSSPESDESIVRLGNVPHGNAFCACGQAESFVPDASFRIPPTPTVAFPIGGEQPPVGAPNPYEAYDISIPTKYRTPLSPDITQELVDNPAMFNQHQIDGHTIKQMTVLPTSTVGVGAIANIPFVTENADATEFTSVFAIQHIEGPMETEFVQLQYTQTALLNFMGMSWPHVVAATLIKAF